MDEKLAKRFEGFCEMLVECDDTQKAKIRELLGVKEIPIGTVAKSRMTGKFMRTDKVYEGNLNKQMTVLIKSLPSDRGITVDEWATLAIENKLETQQSPVRIVAYYRKQIIEMGFAKQV
jgi:hypothetical protein